MREVGTDRGVLSFPSVVFGRKSPVSVDEVLRFSQLVCLSYISCMFLLSRICLRWTSSLTDTVVWTWLASGSSTPRTAKWPPSLRNGPWSDCRLRLNLTLVYWTASWPWVNERLSPCVRLSVFSVQLHTAIVSNSCIADVSWWEYKHCPFALILVLDWVRTLLMEAGKTSKN